MATITEKDKIFKLSQAEYNTLSTTGTLTKDGVTYTYSPSDTIYVTPSAIYFTNVVVDTWIDQSSNPDEGYENYQYKAIINCPGMTENSVVNVIFADAQAYSGKYCNTNEPGTDTLTIYSNNNSTITIPTIIAGEPMIVGTSSRPTTVTITDNSIVSLQDFTNYEGTDIETIEFIFPSGNFECSIHFTTVASGNVDIQLPTGYKHIGTQPSFSVGEEWEIDIKDGRVVAGKVETSA